MSPTKRTDTRKISTKRAETTENLPARSDSAPKIEDESAGAAKPAASKGKKARQLTRRTGRIGREPSVPAEAGEPAAPVRPAVPVPVSDASQIAAPQEQETQSEQPARPASQKKPRDFTRRRAQKVRAEDIPAVEEPVSEALAAPQEDSEPQSSPSPAKRGRDFTRRKVQKVREEDIPSPEAPAQDAQGEQVEDEPPKAAGLLSRLKQGRGVTRRKAVADEPPVGEDGVPGLDDASGFPEDAPSAPAPEYPDGRLAEDADLAVDPDAPDDGSGDAHQTRRRNVPHPTKRRKMNLAVKVVLFVLLCLVVTVVGVFSFNRWSRFDDEADFAGQWVVNQTGVTITVENNEIALAKDTSYHYELDTQAKAVTFTFADLTGQARYRFSLDRQELLIIEGQSTSAWSTALADFWWSVQCVFATIFGTEQPDIQGDIQGDQRVQATLLVRPALAAQRAAQAAADAQAAQEAAARAAQEAAAAAAEAAAQEAAAQEAAAREAAAQEAAAQEAVAQAQAQEQAASSASRTQPEGDAPLVISDQPARSNATAGAQ